jgi:chromosome segregation ATPase
MAQDASLRELQAKYSAALQRIQTLEQEQRSTLELNEMFKEELQQKTQAIEKSSNAYSALKTQYEELLMRVTELHRENQLNQSPQASPGSPPPDTGLVDSLREQIQAISVRKSEHKNEVLRLRARVDELERCVQNLRAQQGEDLRACHQQFVGIVATSVTAATDLPPSEYILESAKELVFSVRNSIATDRYARLKARYRRALARCNEFAAQIEEDRKLLKVNGTGRGGIARTSQVEEELVRLQRFLARYQEKCRKLGDV